MILDSATTPGDLRAACAELEAGRAAAGRTGAGRVVVYIEPPQGLTDGELAELVDGTPRDLGGAGASSVVFVPGPEAPDPAQLLHAVAAAAGGGRYPGLR